MEFNHKVFDKAYKKTKQRKILGAIFLGLCAVLLVLSFLNYINRKNNIKDINGIIVFEDAETDRIAYVDGYRYAYLGSEGDNVHYYLTLDANNYYNIICMKGKNDEYITKEFNATPDEESYRIYGYTKSVPTELRDYAIPVINEILEEDNYITLLNFNDYIGEIYLDVASKNNASGISAYWNVSYLYVIFSVIAGLVGLVTLLTAKKDQSSFEEKAMNTWETKDDFWEEMQAPDTVYLENVKTYLTDKHLMYVASNLTVKEYDDIGIAYVTKHTYNGIPDSNTITIGTTIGEMFDVAQGATTLKGKRQKTEESHETILKTIYEKNPNCIIGYSQNNLNAYHYRVAHPDWMNEESTETKVEVNLNETAEVIEEKPSENFEQEVVEEENVEVNLNETAEVIEERPSENLEQEIVEEEKEA